MSNTFGQLFRLTTFGESHGGAIGGVVDGCPAGVELEAKVIQTALNRRRPGQSPLTTQRKEADTVELLSGVFEGRTLGTPIGFVIRNQDAKSQDYNHLKNVYRPGHADLTWDLKYGHRDYRGGGRSSARETAARVVGGAIAEAFLLQAFPGLSAVAWVQSIHEISAPLQATIPTRETVDAHPTRCPHPETAAQMEAAIRTARKAGDSLGGIVACAVTGMPPGLGEPVFDKLPAVLGHALLSINAVKGVEFGSGFAGTRLTGLQHNDALHWDAPAQRVASETNRAGGTLGGISTGKNLVFRVAFKPTATIASAQKSVDKHGQAATVEGRGRHDPCVLPRAVPIIEAMTMLVLADFALRQRGNRIHPA